MDSAAHPTPHATSIRRLGVVAALAAVYFVVAKASLATAIPPGYATSAWPPSGLALAAVLLLGNRVWPAIWLGAAAVNLTVQSSVIAAIFIGSGNALEAIVGATLIRRFMGVPRRFERGEDVFVFVAIAAAAATVAATIGASSIAASGAIGIRDFPVNWWTWWQGDTSGMIVVTPLLLAFSAPRARTWTRARNVEVAGFAAVVALAGFLSFSGGVHWLDSSPLLLVLTLPPVIWAAFRFEQREVTATIAALCAIAVGFTVSGRGPLASESVDVSLVRLLIFISFVAMTGLAISAVVDERRRAMDALHRNRDELERRVAERTAELQRSEHGERRMNEFLAMLAHELRNPLAPIRNALHLMRMKGASDSTVEWSRNVIDRQVTQLTRLVDDLLDVGRITSGKVVLKREHVDLNAAVLRAVETCEPLARARRQALDVAPARERLVIDGDLIRISQIVQNLLNNAIKYTPDGGRISIAIERDGEWAIIRVVDTGIGISPELLPHVFELFVQGERSLARTEGGLGIGLTIVRQLVALHGGTVVARSAGPGNGSEFVARLPALAAEPDAIAPGSIDQSAPRSPSRRVLVVDDNRDAADITHALVEAWGHAVRVAYDGRSALEIAAEFRPDVVLLDIGLPGMDGYEVAARLRTEAGCATTVLVAFTGYGQEEDRRRVRNAGFDEHLVKPVDPATLEALLQSKAPARAPGTNDQEADRTS